MNNSELICVLVIGAVMMYILFAVQMKWYGVEKWKGIFLLVALVFTGYIGSEMWFYIENGEGGGRSLYGAIVFSPIVFLPLSMLLKIPYGKALDFVAPGGCLTLALVKLQCLNDGCCAGKVLYIDENHFYVTFPSQIVEMVVFLVISAVLFYMASKQKLRGKIFPWFLVLYGGTRFFLDFMRETIPSYLFGLSAGSFWSLCSFIIGTAILVIMKYTKEIKQRRAMRMQTLQEENVTGENKC